MKKINHTILKHLKLSDKIFKYPFSHGIIENTFDPKYDKDFKEYMLIKKDNGQIRLSEEFMFIRESSDKIINLKEADLLDGTWWVLP